MKSLLIGIETELMKFRRLRLIWIMLGLLVFMPAMLGFMMYLAMNPDKTSGTGLMQMKAGMFSSYDWQGFLSVVLQTGAGMGMITTGFVFAWVFGREFTEKTLKDLLALPIARRDIVLSKLLVAIFWSALLLLVFGLVCLAVGTALQLDHYSFVSATVGPYLAQSLLTILAATPVAYVASVSRGIIAPLGFCIVTLILGNLVATMGLGPYYPWTIPALVGLQLDQPGMQAAWPSYGILTLTIVTGVVLTLRQWNRADQQ